MLAKRFLPAKNQRRRRSVWKNSEKSRIVPKNQWRGPLGLSFPFASINFSSSAGFEPTYTQRNSLTTGNLCSSPGHRHRIGQKSVVRNWWRKRKKSASEPKIFRCLGNEKRLDENSSQETIRPR